MTATDDTNPFSVMVQLATAGVWTKMAARLTIHVKEECLIVQPLLSCRKVRDAERKLAKQQRLWAAGDTVVVHLSLTTVTRV